MFNKDLRLFLKIIIYSKIASYEKYKKFGHISLRSWYRLLNNLNLYLSEKKLEKTKININLTNYQIKNYVKIIIDSNSKKSLELNDNEISLLIVFELIKYKKIKILLLKKEHNLSWNDIYKIKKICSKYLEFEVNWNSLITNEDFCKFLNNWLFDYFKTKDITNILLTQSISKYFPYKIQKKFLKTQT